MYLVLVDANNLAYGQKMNVKFILRLKDQNNILRGQQGKCLFSGVGWEVHFKAIVISSENRKSRVIHNVNCTMSFALATAHR